MFNFKTYINIEFSYGGNKTNKYKKKQTNGFTFHHKREETEGENRLKKKKKFYGSHDLKRRKELGLVSPPTRT